jgi:glycosyltransferase involved in cell wall biosynthesis
MLPPDHSIGHPGEHRGRRAVQLCLARPVEDQIGLSAAKDSREASDSHDPSMCLTKPTRGNHLDVKTCVDQLLWPGTGLQEDELQLMPTIVGAFENCMKHRLGTPEALPPRHRYKNTHRTPSATDRMKSVALTSRLCADSVTVGDYPKDGVAASAGRAAGPASDAGAHRRRDIDEIGCDSIGPVASLEVNSSAAQPKSEERVALAHDYLLVMRGAERTFAAMADLYPHAPIFTLLYDEIGTNERFRGRSITTSSLQRLGVGQAAFRRLLPLYPWAVERLKLPAADVVLSSSSAFAHGVRVPTGAVHVCYCHAPFRYAWYEQARALGEVAAPLRPLLRVQLSRMRRWDLAASRRVDSYVANSRLTRERIRRFYGRDATIIHPPVETHRFAPGAPGDSLLIVSELVRHKRLDVALEAARRARTPIRVAGNGPEYAALSAAYPEAEFLGRVSDADLVELYATARAVVVPSVEEFGITAVEAQAAGRPIIAAAAGGALETVVAGQTGLLASVDNVDSFVRAIDDLDSLDFDPDRAVQNAGRFSVDTFRRRLSEHVGQVARGGGEGTSPEATDTVSGCSPPNHFG